MSARAWPSRRHYSFVTLFFVGVAAYGSLVPFDFIDLSVVEAFAALRTLALSARPPARPADWAANVLLAVPIGYFLLGALVGTGRRLSVNILGGVVAAGACVGFAVGLEFAQLWVPDRSTSVTDVTAQGLGGTAGVLLWLISGPTVTQWLQHFTHVDGPRTAGLKLLEAYLFGFLVYAILPLNLTISPAGLYRKFRDGRIVMVPFADLGLDLNSAYELVRDILVFIPIGILVARWRMPRGYVRPLGTCLVVGATVALGTECAQLLVYSRFATATDVVLGTVGTGAGAWLTYQWMVRVTNRDPIYASQPHPSDGRLFSSWRLGTTRWLGVSLLYGVGLVLFFCGPFDIVLDDPDQLRARFSGFFAVPFARSQTGSPFNAMSDILRKLILFGGFAGLLTISLSTLRLSRQTFRLGRILVVLVTAGLAGGIEVVQVLFPPHVPDVTDVLLAAAAGTGATLVTWHALSTRSTDGPTGR